MQETHTIDHQISLKDSIDQYKTILEENGTSYPMLIIHRSEEVTIITCSHSDPGIIRALGVCETGVPETEIVE